MLTIRQKIIQALKESAMDALQLSQTVNASQRAVEAHLQHVIKTIGPALEIQPAECRTCGFGFRSRSKLTKPSKCPQCHSQSITLPLFRIKAEPK